MSEFEKQKIRARIHKCDRRIAAGKNVEEETARKARLQALLAQQ